LRETRLGKRSSKETRPKLIAFQSTRLKHPVKEVKVTNIQSGEIKIYDSTRSAGRAFDIHHGTIRNYIKSKKRYPPPPTPPVSHERERPGGNCIPLFEGTLYQGIFKIVFN
jgi:hypothetical protein